ncbi:zinc phosphodiesterase ELAC protein 2-like protein [Corchorus olitorius]|uniref:ribonuclease Z n=1 Tax=Corchorus olitorius TaxID=93759 RepID=A0A1R3HFD5_9ROSI|nr:zinc phosphodiesterase ELAC protein 2-like protein [Corchorus olitorius]
MVKTKEFKFNEARADGGDKTCKPKKNFQLKRHIGGSGNTSAYVQILGIGMDTHDTTPSVLLFFDKQRFIFNAGEGLQRFCTEHKIKLSKIDHICFSRVCSETAGGLPGLLLTLAGMGDGVSVNMWGPSNLNLLVDAMKCFIPHDAMVHTHLISHTGPLQTDNPSAEGSNFKDDHSIAAPGLISSTEDPVSECKSISAENLLKFTLRPHTHLGLDRSNVPSSLVASEVIDELLLESPDIVDAAQDVKQLWQKAAEKKVCTISMQDSKIKVEELILDEDSLPRCLENIQREDLEIIFLGTGSSQPSKYRNVTAIYLNLFSRGSLLLDCGEGTLAQLRRRYGMEGSNNAVKKLACVWISHIHADHHAGLARILALRRDLLKEVPHEPLIVIGPSQLERFLDAYQRLEDLDMQFFDNKTTTIVPWETFELDNESSNNQLVPENNEGIKHFDLASKFSESLQGSSKRRKLSVPVDNVATFPLLKRLKKVLNEAGLERLVSFPVVHCPEAFGVILKAADRINSSGKVIPGWKVVLFKDQIDTQSFSIVAAHASPASSSFSLKATFEDGMDGEAIAKNHSTTKEAIEVGDSAAAYRIILTHFSQRYPKVPALDETSMQKTCIAFDFMSINIADLPVLPKVIPYLKLLFKSEMMIDNFNDVETDA